MTPEQKFWSRVQVGGLDECWPWLGERSVHGYGRFGLGGKRRYAHRIAYEFAREPLGTLCALHHCDNPPCVNPLHLHAGTAADNVADMRSRQRHSFGERHRISKLTTEIVREALVSPLRDADLAQRVGATAGAISAARRGVSWRHVTGLQPGAKPPKKTSSRPRGARHHLGGLTHCKRGHVFTPENTYMSDGSRVCRTCRAERCARYGNTQRAKALKREAQRRRRALKGSAEANRKEIA